MAGVPVLTPTAIRVRPIDLQNPNPPNAPCCPPRDFSGFEVGTCTTPGETSGCARWVGRSATFLESQDFPNQGSFRGARLQCTPYFKDWSADGVVHVMGSEIMPSSSYELRVFAQSCAGTEATCTAISCTQSMTTARWGDVVAPFSPPVTSEPSGGDVVAVLNKFKYLLGAPSRTASKVIGNYNLLLADVGALDISAVVDAFKGLAYPYSGPCPCPSQVLCGAQSCTSVSDCAMLCVGGEKFGQKCEANCDCCPGDALCLDSPFICSGTNPPECVLIGGVCVRTCLGGPNSELPCTSDLNCNRCSGGVYADLPCDPTGSNACPGGWCGTKTCTRGQVGAVCSSDNDCDTEQGTCDSGACRDAEGNGCGFCSVPLEDCHCEGLCGGVTVSSSCGITAGGTRTDSCRDRCGRCRQGVSP